jgi:hypothetical protein
MDQITECEQTNYAIELTVNKDGLTITNAEDSLKEYIEAHGGFTDDNLLRLVDMSGTLSYTVSPIIQETVAEAYGPRFLSLCINRELKIDATNIQGQVSQLIKYAEATQRYPICIYEPDLSGALLSLFKPHFKEEELLIVGNRMELVNFDTNVKVVYTHKIPRKWTNNIPLLISGAGMMFGGDRQIWLQSAEKVVYFAKDIYTKSSKGKEICRLD